MLEAVEEVSRSVSGVFASIAATVLELGLRELPEARAGQDAWHGPTTAVRTASFTAGLVGCYLELEEPLPDDLAEAWPWFTDGHAVMGFEASPAEGPQSLVVF